MKFPPVFSSRRPLLGRLVDTSAVKFFQHHAIRVPAAALAAALVLAPALASAEPPPPAALPPLKKAIGAPKVDKADGPRDAKREPTAEERAARGVVTIERAGQPLALGSVLMGDGRILTALSPLGPGNDLDARFADGSTAKVKVGHHDRAWDLALLVPQTGRWAEGVAASSREPVRPDAVIRSFSAVRNKVSIVPMILRSHRGLLGGDDRPIENALEIGSRVTPLDLGSPIIDEDGRVVGMLGRGCAPNDKGGCTPVAFGAPIGAIRGFLRTVPPTAVAPAPWLGVRGVSETEGVAKGVRLLAVQPKSPADEARLKGGERGDGDVILAVGGVPVTTPEALADAIRSHGIGEKVPITLLSNGKYREQTVLLRPAPEARSAPPPGNQAELPAGEPPPRPALPGKRPAPPQTRH